jgi:dipeptidyl aminopeptidase/acylaminoacyl peptidase
MAMTANMYSLREVPMGALPWDSQADDLTGRRGPAIWMMKKAVHEKRMPPVLLFHGAQDVGVSPEQPKAIWRACKYHEPPCELVLYPREGHGFVERLHIMDLHRRVLGFVEQHTI